MNVKVLVLVAVAVALFSVTSGCVPPADLYVGKPVSAPVVTLHEGPGSAGTWQTFDMTINYSYVLKGGVLQISGQGELSQHYQMNYDEVSRLRVFLFLLDGDGKVLETVDINAYLANTEDKFTFNMPNKAPENIKGFSFGYSGVARDRDGQNYFYSLP